MEYLWCFNILQKPHIWKILVLVLLKKTSRPIRCENFLILNISGTDLRLVYNFCMQVAINGTNEQTGLVWIRHAPGMSSANQI